MWMMYQGQNSMAINDDLMSERSVNSFSTLETSIKFVFNIRVESIQDEAYVEYGSRFSTLFGYFRKSFKILFWRSKRMLFTEKKTVRNDFTKKKYIVRSKLKRGMFFEDQLFSDKRKFKEKICLQWYKTGEKEWRCDNN